MIARATEAQHRHAHGLSAVAPEEALARLLDGQRSALAAVEPALPALAAAAGRAAAALAAGHRVAYAGAGSAGLMALADALEIAGTFGIPAERTPVLFAGGAAALLAMTGAVEDDRAAAARDIAAAALGPGDAVVCVSASGSTPYTLAVAEAARAAGATVIAIVNTPASPLLALADEHVLLDTGPEVVAGSTRMGAGTAQKAALNLLSTLAALRLGHVHDGFMVNLVADNAKLRDRAAGIVAALSGTPDAPARAALAATGGAVKPAVLLAAGAGDPARAAALLAASGGHLGPALDALRSDTRADPAPHQQGVTKMTLTRLTAALLGSTLLAGTAFAQDVTLTIESWRNDDLAIWQEKIIPAFEASHPGIKLNFTPSAPTEYNAALNSKLDAGSAGDLITCRPFDASLELFNKGKLADLTGLAAMANFSDVAKSGWSTDDGAQTFCVPMASVIHGFIYNKAAFEEAGVEPPKTEAEFFAVLDKIKEGGTYIPMAMGTNDQWEAATMGYQNIGPNYWKGEDGRLALIKGEQKLTDDAWVAPFREIAKWKDYLGDGFEAQTYPDSQNLFTLGRAAVYPAGSWEIAPFRAQIADSFEMGAFPPPVPAEGDDCYISDHVDIAIGMNAATANPDAAKAFLEWVGSAEFAQLYANALPGFFPLVNAPVTLEDPLAQEFVSWRETCKSTIRSTYQILSRGTPNLENETWNASANVIRGTETPEAAAQRLQDGLASWFEPQKN